MTKESMGEFMQDMFNERIMFLRKSGQEEYAGRKQEDAFNNFNKLSQELDIDRKKVLWTYAMKHKDGIAAHLRGHTSQREEVSGRIDDLIMYLFLLAGMIHEEEQNENNGN
jgi:hypothetical protein